MKASPLTVALLLIARFGCADSLSEQQTQDVEAAKRYVHLLQLRAFKTIEADVDESISGQAPDVLTKMADQLPDANVEAESLDSVGTSTLQTPNGQQTTVIVECHCSDKWFLANITMRRTGSGRRIVGFYLKPIPDSVAEMKHFTILGKSVRQYAVLLLSLICLSITIRALWLCFRTTTGKVKLLYSTLILLGVGQLGVDWNTGKTFGTLLAFHLPPVWAISPPYSPWVVYVSVPVGALIFLLRRNRQIA